MAKLIPLLLSVFLIAGHPVASASEANAEKMLLAAYPGYRIPVSGGDTLKKGPYFLEGDLDLDGKKDFISILTAPNGKWMLAIVFSKTGKVETIYKESPSPFSEEMGLSLFTLRDFEKWKKERAEGDPLLADAQHVTFAPFAIVVAYGEMSAQAFYWKDDRFQSFWIAD